MAFTIVLPAIAGCQTNRPEIDVAALEQRLQAELEEIVTARGYPGMTAAFVLPDGRIVSLAAGLDDVERQIPMRPQSRLMAGSIGKTFVAAAALALASEGVLHLDDKLSRWLGEEPWYRRLPNASDITLRMLLTHSSGLPNYLFDPVFGKKIVEAFSGKAANRDFYLSPEELVAFALDDAPLFAAGRGYAYSDTNYILMGLVIERATAHSYEEELTRRFLVPLDLDRTQPADRPRLPDLAAGYIDRKNELGLAGRKAATDGVLIYNPATEWTGGGLVTNAVDLARWAKALYEESAMDGDYLDQLLNGVAVDAESGARYGLAVDIIETSLGTRYGHGGWMFGYVSQMSYYPRLKLAAALQINTDASDSAERVTMREALEDLVNIAAPYLQARSSALTSASS